MHLHQVVGSFILTLAFLLAACEVPFTPKGEFRRAVAVYGILSDRTDTMLVRVFETYDPPDFDPLAHGVDEPVRGAEVDVSDGIVSIRLDEATRPRWDVSRYSDSVVVYQTAPAQIQEAVTYALSIRTADGRQFAAATTVPGSGLVEIVNPSALITTSVFPTIQIRSVLSPAARGFRIRCFVRFEILENAQWIPYEREIPRQVESPDTPKERWHYHELTRRTSDGGSSQEVISFMSDAYRRGLGAIDREFSGQSLRWVSVAFILVQVDLHLYNYYNTANAFRDPYTTRVDQPDYSNIEGGVGVFGAMIHDSSVFVYPPGIAFSR